MNMALIASPFPTGVANKTYYASRKASYGRNNSYLIDEGLKSLQSSANWKDKLKHKRDNTAAVTDWSAHEFVLNKAAAKRELIVVDGHIHNNDLFSKLIKPGVELLRIDNIVNGFVDLMNKLGDYEGLNAIHLFAHNQNGQVLLGNQLVAESTIQNGIQSYSQYNQSIAEGGELLIYNTQLENNERASDNLEIIKGEEAKPTVSKLTFKADKLSINKGDINAYPEEGSIARNYTPFVATVCDFNYATDTI